MHRGLNSIPEHQKLFEELLKHKNGLTINSIHIVCRSVMAMDEKAKLSSVGLNEFEPVFFTVNGEGYCNGGLNKSSNLEGSVLNIKTDNGVQQVIFIPENVPCEPTIPAEHHDDWAYMLKLVSLSHELGHVMDMQMTTGSNFEFSDKLKVNLVEAEAFAHAYSLEYLHKAGAHIARNTVASALYKASSSAKKFEKHLYQSVCRKVGKGRLTRWAD